MSDLAKKMMARHLKDEDGAASASGSAGATSGASVTGNAGLSSLGSIPNGPLGVIGSASKKKRRECKSCGYVQQHEGKICFECGDKLPRMNEATFDERLADYRTEQIHLSNGTGYGWIGGAVSQIMNMMRTGYPEIIHENEELNDAILQERVTDMLCEFEKWRLRHTNCN
jgi:hypothetical protein